MTGHDELALLSQSFDQMADAVAAQQRQLREQGEYIALLLDSTAEAIYGVDTEGICTFVNPACLRILGYANTGDLVGQSIHNLIHHSYADGRPYPKEACRVRLSTRQGQIAHADDEVHWRADGSSFPVEYWSHPMYRDGRLIGAVVTFIDITERKQVEEELRRYREHLEEMVQSRTAELKTVNQELESFAYSVSHDLRAPLRSIDGFSQVLLEDHGEQIDATGRDHLQRVRAATQRMSALIDDLLKLSRLSRATLQPEAVDLSALAQDILNHLHEAEPERPVISQVMPGLLVQGDRGLLQVALENLLGNAWKYSAKTGQARIEFGSTDQDGAPVYFVRDNGAGFDMAHAGKLFGAFQRLHHRDEFEGTGIGLATVQRVIHRHGGRVWAESAIGQGATFFFTLGQPVSVPG
ncbi:MAG: PAS domain S-box protein [Hydrogenophilaceae bacterium]|nr:PAS domain S-box protein [Hydrogenophilaceae bacterium]